MSEEENKLIVFETVEKLTLQNPIGSTVKKIKKVIYEIFISSKVFKMLE